MKNQNDADKKSEETNPEHTKAPISLYVTFIIGIGLLIFIIVNQMMQNR